MSLWNTRGTLVVILSLFLVALAVQGVASPSSAKGYSTNTMIAELRSGTSKSSTTPSESTHALSSSRPGYSHKLREAAASELRSTSETATEADPKTIFFGDDRERVSPPLEPVTWLGMYDSFGTLIGTCTGTFIGPGLVLTAGHCLYDSRNGWWSNSIRVVPGKDGLYEPYGFLYSDASWVPAGWHDSFDPNWDWGLVRLPSLSLGNSAGWFPLGALTDEQLFSADLWPGNVAYPQDKSYGTQWAHTVQQLIAVDDYSLMYGIDVWDSSGSPILTPVWDAVIGIHGYEGSAWNEAARVSPQMISYLLTWCPQISCGFNYFVNQELTPTPVTPTPTPMIPTETPTFPTATPVTPTATPVTPTATPTQPSSNDAFTRTWQRTDKPVADQMVNRTWMWGPQAFTGQMSERYEEAPEGQRTVVYYDKSRMEITTDPNVSPTSPWYVTNGLLATELITGRRQVGNNAFEQQAPAQVNVAGDPDDRNAPIYATFAGLLGASANSDGAAIVKRVDRFGNVTDDASLVSRGVYAAYRVQVQGIDHQVASPFWEFMNSSGTVYENGQFQQGLMFENPFYATGYPITEAYWATVKVAGTYQEVLIQCFERRCLTYTPGNTEGWKVEAGNVGQHYYRWRYGN